MSLTEASGGPPPSASAPYGTRRTAFKLALAAFAFVLAFRALYVPFALAQDEGDYFTATMQALSGESLYAAQHSARPPLLYAYYSAAWGIHKATGLAPDISVHAIGALLAAATVALLAFALSRRFGSGAAVTGTVLAAMMACSPPLQAVDANAETLMLLPYTAAGLMMWRWARREPLDHPVRDAALAGLLTVIAIMTKQVAGVLIFLAVAAIVIRRRDALRLLGGFAGAVAVTTAAFLLWAAATGQLAEWIVFGWLGNFLYAANAAGPERGRIASVSIYRMRVLVGLPLGVALIAGAWPRRDDSAEDRSTMWFALVWIALSAVAVSASGFFFPHYFVQLIPALGLLAALATDKILRFAASIPNRWFSLAATACLLAVMLGGPGFHAFKSLATYPQLPLPTDQELKPLIGAWVASLTDPKERVLAYSPLRGINPYADRLAANAVPDGSLSSMRAFNMYGTSDGSTLLGVRLVEPRRLIAAQWDAAPPDVILIQTAPGQPLGSSSNQYERGLDAELTGHLGSYREVARRRFGVYESVLYRRDAP